MGKPRSTSPIDQAATQLRDLALSVPPGDLMGSEDEVIEKLGVSRVTVRQAARLVERDGLLMVRRGKKGGYFSARPSLEMMEAVVCAYLDTLGIGAMHTGSVATALWVESIRQATMADRDRAGEVAARLEQRMEQLAFDADIITVAALEQEFRSEIFTLIDGNYVSTIFHINAAFARLHLETSGMPITLDKHIAFVRKWRSAKILQCQAIAGGDMLLGVMAALQDRSAWTERGIRAWQEGTEPAQTR